jgi:hypothetical protein
VDIYIYIHICDTVCSIAGVEIITIMVVIIKNNFKYFKHALICDLILLNHNCTYGKSLVCGNFRYGNIVVVLLLPADNVAFHSFKKMPI